MKSPAFLSALSPAKFGTERPMSRDKSDTLLLLVACALVLAPQAADAPLWVSIGCSLLLLWRGWLTFRGKRLPPRWLLLPVSLLAMAGVFATFKTLLGREAGVAMLVLLLTLKLLEMHARRDLFVVVFLSFFLILTNFFHSQSIGAALMTAVTVIMMLTAQLSFQYTGAVPPLLKRLKLGMLIFALAVPLTLVMFILFPRIQGPLWGLPGDAHTAQTGMSDSMTPGNISQLAQSEAVAFRVNFIDPPPPKSSLYWRVIVLGDFDGKTWRRQPTVRTNRAIAFSPRGRPIRHQVTLEPHGKRWMVALELPQAPPALADMTTAIAADRQLTAAQPLHGRVRYEAASYVDFQLQADETYAQQRNWLELPQQYNPATHAFAAGLRQTSADDAQLVDAVLRHFREQPFRYTLQPPLLGRDSIDEFLFTTRAGFCEHYAGAFAVVMRAAGIPARVVTGYQGGEINPVDGFMTVRQSDAHAWAEVWLAQRGWVRVDPTAAVAPSRVEQNLSRAVPPSILGGLVNINVRNTSWLMSLRHNWDAINNAWNQSVLNYTPDRQKKFIQSLGFDDVDWRTLTFLLLGVGAIVVAIIALPLVLQRQKIDPARALYDRFCQRMARKGLVRAPHEGPKDYRMRIVNAGITLEPEKKLAADRFLQCYERMQYGTVDASAATATLSQLKSLFKQCR